MTKITTVIDRGATASKPASPTEGYLYYDTDENRLERYSGSAWEVCEPTSATPEDHDHSGDAGDGGTFDAANLTSAGATDGYVLTADGASGAAWEEAAAAASTGEIFLTAAGGWPSTSNGCADNAKNEYGTNDVDLYSLDFDPDSDEYAQWTVVMPSDWDASTITAIFYWAAASSSGDVIWALQGRAYANDDAIDQAWGSAQTATDTLTATGDVCITSATSAITLAGTPAASQLVQFRAYRDADAGGDTLDADAQLLGIMVTYGKS